MGRRRSRLSLAAVPGLSSLPPISAAQAAEVTSSIRVPLQTLAYSTGPQPPVYKYGIDASLGGATTPQLFVFDTGGEGFQAAHHPSAVWWGSNVSDTGTSFNEPFISQERDISKVVQTGFSLFGLPGQGSAPLFSSSTSDDKVGHANPIELRVTKVGPDASGSPPVQTTFYGDFGLTLKHGSEGIDNLFAQLTDGGNAKPGDIVSLGPYGSMGGSSLQLGLSEADLSNPHHHLVFDAGRRCEQHLCTLPPPQLQRRAAAQQPQLQQLGESAFQSVATGSKPGHRHPPA
ncbi:MAG: hypothetical protein ACK52U_04780 [Synechococcaceae cyanobacterium]